MLKFKLGQGANIYTQEYINISERVVIGPKTS